MCGCVGVGGVCVWGAWVWAVCVCVCVCVWGGGVRVGVGGWVGVKLVTFSNNC